MFKKSPPGAYFGDSAGLGPKVLKKSPAGAYFGDSAGLGPKVLKKNPLEHKFHYKMASKIEN